MDIKIKVEGLSKLKGNLKKKIDKLQDLTQFFKSVGDYVVRQTQNERFEKEQSPEGVKWKPLSQARHKQRLKRHKTGKYKILRDHGELRRSIKEQVSVAKDHVIIGSNLQYAAIHQFGGTIHFKKKKGLVTIPARPYLGLNEKDKQHIIMMFQGYINRHVLGSI